MSQFVLSEAFTAQLIQIDEDGLEIGASSLQPPLSNMLSDRHQAFHVPRSTIGLHTPGRVCWSTLAANHPSTSEKTKKRERTMFSVLGAEARRLMLPGPVVAAAHCKTHQKLEIFGNFVASRSAGPFVGRHFLLERHFAGEMISVGKARRCPFKTRRSAKVSRRESACCTHGRNQRALSWF